MFRFLLGVAVASAGYYVISSHPEWVHDAVDVGRRQLEVASRNIKAAVKADHDGRERDADARSTQIDSDRVERMLPAMERLDSDRLWRVLHEDDLQRRAAAGQVLLVRTGIPVSAEGVELVRQQYLQSPHLEEVMSGFTYLGLLALQDVREDSITRLVQSHVERRPRSQSCDNALWALGQVGSEDAADYFFKIIDQDQKYGPVARERAFCCLAQCGRYSRAQRLEFVPRFIQVYETAGDARSRTWAMQALGHCAPRARCRSIEEWQAWWSEQEEFANTGGSIRDRLPWNNDRG